MSTTATMTRRYTNYVNGQDREGQDGATFESINPTTGAAFGRFVESELGKWQKIVKETGVKPE